MVSYHRPELDGLPEIGLAGRQLWLQSRGSHRKVFIQTADPLTTSRRSRLIQLEDLGFCGKGKAKDFIADGAIGVGGSVPINTQANTARRTSTDERDHQGRVAGAPYVGQPG